MREIARDCLVSPYAGPRPRDWAREFGRSGQVVLEIGSGDGDFLVRMAQEHPDRDFIGIEQEWERVKKTLRKITLRRQESGDPAWGRNIRVFFFDATVVLQRFIPPQLVRQVYGLFPCPWPKKKHVRHRLFSPEFLRLLNSRIAPRGEALIVTDDRDYSAWVGEQLPGSGFHYRSVLVPPRFQTKYERKWLAGGQQEFFEWQLVKAEHRREPVLEDTPMKIFATRNFCWDKFRWQDILGSVTVVLKESLFDREQEKAMFRFVVSEPAISQPVWVTVYRRGEGWSIAKSFGHPVIPTDGVAQALCAVAQAAARSGECDFWATDETAAPEG